MLPRSVARLDENAASAALTLTAGELAHLGSMLALQPVSGTRYPEGAMALLNG